MYFSKTSICNLSKSTTKNKVFKIAKYIKENPGCTSEDIRVNVLKCSPNHRGYFSKPMADLVKSGITSSSKSKGYHITSYGINIVNNILKSEV
jgi:predicted HTH transcriptional regulator